MTIRGVLLGGLLLCVSSSSAQAQQGDTASTQENDTISTVMLAAGGVVGGVGGFFGGALIGGELGGGSKLCGDDPCGFAGAVMGAVVGEVVGIPLGVWLANRARGNVAGALALSGAVVAGVGLLLSQIDAGDNGGEVLWIAIPVTQIAASVGIIKRTGH